MSENIELTHFNSKYSDNDEYHEIHENSSNKENSNHIPKTKLKPIKEYDFFTQSDVKTVKKTGARNKKHKAPDKPTDLMDLITSELSANAPVISENVISKVDLAVERNGFLRKTPLPRSLRMYKLKPPSLDSENGWLHKITDNNLSPVFPNVIENMTSDPTEIPVQYVEPITYNELVQNNIDEDATGATKFLDVEITNVKFKYHYKFTLETLLSSKLVECYDEYIKNEKYIKDIARDIKVSRQTKDNLKHELATVSPSKKDELRFDPTVRKYTAKLLRLKERYFDLIKTRKELIHYLVLLWTDLDMVRHKSENIVTPVILKIHKQTLNDKDFEKQWDDTFNEEFSDMLYKVEFDFVTQYLEYKQSKNDENVEIAKRKTLKKPKLKIDEDEMKKQVEEIVNDIVIEDKYDFTLIQDKSIVTSSIRVEHAYHFEIYVDDIFVCKSEDFHIEVDKIIMNIDFAESFSVQILPKNTNLNMVLFEDDDDVATIKTDIIELKKNNSKAEFEPKLFTYNNIVEPNVVFIGSGHDIKDIAAANKVRLKSSNLFKRNMFSTCKADVKLQWNEKLNKNSSEAIRDSMKLGRHLKRLLHGTEKPNIGNMSEIISKLYGKDIENDENIINILKDVCETSIGNDDKFLIDENSPDFARLKLLHLRNSGGFKNIENKLIPLHATQISTEQLNCLQKSNTNEFNLQYYNNIMSAEMDAIELQRFVSHKYVEKLNVNMLKNLNEYLLKKTHKDVVRDFQDLSLRNIFSRNTSLVNLAAMSSTSKQQLLNEAITKEQEIQVIVYRAFNLFDRSSDLINEDGEDDERIAGFKVRPLRPFVKMSYRGINIQTATAIGCHPTWNQTVKIKTRLDPISVLQINIFDEQKVNITDPCSDDEQSSHSRTIQYRYQSKWLGTLRVPLHSVLTLGTLHGTFKVSTPPMLFGYENTEKKESTQSLIPEVTQFMRKDSAFISLQITTSLSHLGGLQGYHQPVSSNTDDDFLIKHINNFVTNYLNDFPSRNINLTFIESCGRNKCVTQFLQPIPLPDHSVFPKNPKVRIESALSKSSGVSKSSSSRSSGRKKDLDVEKASPTNEESYGTYESWKNEETQLGKIMNACSRYVALIPTYEVKESHVVTLVGMELLKVLQGSPLDHTILLASYFLYLGIKNYIAIGLGLPRGLSSYVLTKFDLTTRRVVMTSDPIKSRGFLSRNENCVWYVYDGTTGERFQLRDVGCPLKSVGYVFDEENIWVNMQVTQDCESVSFDFSRSSDWQPVFDKTIYVMKLPIITDTSIYQAPLEVERLRAMLEMKIKAKVQKWRPHMKTMWNRYCSSLLKETLPHWEYWTFNPTDAKPGLSQRLKQLMVTYKMFGFPLNMPFISTKTVTSTVKSTAVYMNDDPNVEFGLAVDVYAYPNNVISVWVFLASITRT